MIKLLLDNGANPGLVGKNGTTALHHALQCNDEDALDLVKNLLEVPGAGTLEDTTRVGTNCVCMASMGHLDVLKLVLEEMPHEAQDPLNSSNEYGLTPLMHAAKAGNLVNTEFLLGLGVDVNQVDNRGQTALHWACRSQNSELVQLLVDAGADVNARSKAGHTPIFFLARTPREANWGSQDEIQNRCAAIKCLVDSGANFQMKDKKGRTLLHYAETAKSLEYLLGLGLNIESRDDAAKATPLMLAARNERMSYSIGDSPVRFLIDHGANVEASDLWGRNPLAYAASGNHYYVVSVLEESGADRRAKDKDGVAAVEWQKKWRDMHRRNRYSPWRRPKMALDGWVKGGHLSKPSKSQRDKKA